jgi:hypothetical protein
MSDQETLTVVTTVPSKLRGDNDQARDLLEKAIPLDTLQKNFASFLDRLQQIVALGQDHAGEFLLGEIEFSAEVGGNGEFKLLGSGVGVSVNSAITFTLRKRHSAE